MKALAPLALLLALVGFAAPTLRAAGGPMDRTWVDERTGKDNYDCSAARPCASFARALEQTKDHGTIGCLSPGDHGAFTITDRSVSITCAGASAGITVKTGTAITINNASPDAHVYIEGLDLSGMASATSAIAMTGVGRLTISRTNIHDFTGPGIDMAGGFAARAVIDNVRVLQALGGLRLKGIGGAANYAIVHDSLFESNHEYGVSVDGTSIAVLDSSVLTGNPHGLVSTNGGLVVTDGNNIIRPNGVAMLTIPQE